MLLGVVVSSVRPTLTSTLMKTSTPFCEDFKKKQTSVKTTVQNETLLSQRAKRRNKELVLLKSKVNHKGLMLLLTPQAMQENEREKCVVIYASHT